MVKTCYFESSYLGNQFFLEEALKFNIPQKQQNTTFNMTI